LSRNKDRLGLGDTKPDNNPPPPQALQQDNPGFAFVVPTEFVELPSHGKYYGEGHPLHDEESIEIKQMTAKEEDILTSRTLLKKGVALDRVLQSLIVDKDINAHTLLVGDRNAIIIAARSSAYGNMYETQVTCPSCQTTQDYAFDLNEMEIYTGVDLDASEITANEDGTFDVTLPRTTIVATFRLLSGVDEKTLLQASTARKGAYEKTVTAQLSKIVVGVNGVRTQEAVDFLVQYLPSIDSRYLRRAYKTAAPNIDLTQYFECGECDYEADMEVPLTADFFWPGG
jgi:hypothetical protein